MWEGKTDKVSVDLDLLTQLCQTRHSCREMSAELGVSFTTVRRKLKLLRLTPNGNKSPTNDRLEEIKQVYFDDELSTYQTSQKLGIAQGSVSRVLEGVGLSLRTRSEGIRKARSKKVDESKLIRLYTEERLSCKSIAKTFHIGHKKVREILSSNGILLRGRGELRGQPLGWRKRNAKGYIVVKVPNHSHANRRGWVLEHILVWETINGQSLPQGWHVHHLNGIRDDNREENLEAMSRSDHGQVISKIQSRIKELEAQVTNDRLAKLFLTQRSLMEKYKDIESKTGLLPTRKIPVDLSSYKGQERIRQAMWNIVAELGELAEGLHFKPWKLDPKLPDEAYLRNELGDLIHFVLELLILMGIDQNEVEEIYYKMVEKNKARQEENY